MTGPAAYKSLRKQQAKDMRAASLRNKTEDDRLRAIERDLYERLLAALQPYHNQTLDDKYKVTIGVDSIMMREIKFFVNKKLWLTFKVETEWHGCTRVGCEGGPCNHDYLELHFIVIQHKPKGDYQCYFPCDNTEVSDEEKFAVALAKMMDDYKSQDLL